jgi:dGTPase
VAAERGHVYHNRLTHSLKVGQLARRLAEKLAREQPDIASVLGGLDPDVAEAAGLAHDLGHPPFGHVAEEMLDRLVRRKGRLADGFEGNAQSFRIVTRLAVSDALPTATRAKKTGSGEGLNLTRATLNAILKYPWLHGQNRAKKDKWGAYNSEAELFTWVRASQPFPGLAKSIEAELMDWADDITFAVHDLIDFFCAGRIPLERFGEDGGTPEQDAFFQEVFSRCPDLLDRRATFEEAFETIIERFLIDRRYTGTVHQRRHIWQLSSFLISRFVEAIRLQPNPHAPVHIEDYAKDEIRVLKELTWHYVILHHDLATGQHGQQHIIESLFTMLVEASHARSRWKLFPPSLQERLQDAGTNDRMLARVVTDHIAGMTEKEATWQFRILTGTA